MRPHDKLGERIMMGLLTLGGIAIVGVTILILYYIVANGASVLSIEFLTEPPRKGTVSYTHLTLPTKA